MMRSFSSTATFRSGGPSPKVCRVSYSPPNTERYNSKASRQLPSKNR